MDRFPSAAFTDPPEIGASRYSTPTASQRAAISFANRGGTVAQANTAAPFGSLAAIP